MRPQSHKKVKIRNTVIGGPKVVVCLPLAAEERTGLLAQASKMASMKPDLLEWRVDSYNGAENTTDCLDLLKALRERIGPLPLIFTCRSQFEGGLRPLSQTHRLNLIDAAIRSGLADIADIEIRNDAPFIESVRAAARQTDVPLILSCHDFKGTPAQEIICDILVQAQTLGADIAKIAVMPKDLKDVLTLMNATHQARTTKVQIPIVTMAMGAIGAITRIAGGLFGSDMTFAMGQEASAPGQIPIDRLRQAMAVIYR